MCRFNLSPYTIQFAFITNLVNLRLVQSNAKKKYKKETVSLKFHVLLCFISETFNKPNVITSDAILAKEG